MRDLIRVRQIVRCRWGSFVAVTLAIWTCHAPARAGCGTQVAVRRTAPAVVVQKPAFAVVPFAVPVAVPVATIAQPAVFYGYRQYAAGSDQPSAVSSRKLTADGFSADRPPAESISTIARSCVACHGGTAPKAGLDLTDLTRLTPQQRLQAVARVVSDDPSVRMPPSRPLPPAEIGRVLQELSEPGPGPSPRAANAGADR